jgi:hypothetical protein
MGSSLNAPPPARFGCRRRRRRRRRGGVAESRKWSKEIREI